MTGHKTLNTDIQVIAHHDTDKPFGITNEQTWEKHSQNQNQHKQKQLHYL